MTQKRKSMLILCGIAAGAFIITCILNIFIPPHSDIRYFKIWGNQILTSGTSSFYEKGFGSAAEYPPVYLIISACISWVCRITHANQTAENFFFRLPSALILIGSVFSFYHLARSFFLEKKSLILTAVFAFAPAIIIDIVWGQADCFIMFYILSALAAFVKKKYFLTMLVCVLGVLTKLQFLFFIPLTGVAIFHRMYKEKKLKKLIGYISACLAAWIILYLPFTFKQIFQGRFFYMFELIFSVFGHLGNFANNAFNIYTAIGLNFVNTQNFGGPIFAGIMLIVILCPVMLFIKKPTDVNLILLTAFTFTAAFMLMTGMHERYMLPVFGAMLIAAHIIKNKNLLIVNYFFYVMQFLNSLYAWAFFRITEGKFLLSRPVDAIVFSMLSVIIFGLFIYEVIKYALKKETEINAEGKSILTEQIV